jgi:hypothetical protein
VPSISFSKGGQGGFSKNIRQEIGLLNQRIDGLGQKVDTQVGQVNQKIDSQCVQVRQEISQLNQAIFQFIVTKQKES